MARDAKENVCKVDDKNSSVGEMQLDRKDYHLPDGEIIQFDRARSEYSEYFFTRQSRTNEVRY